MDHICSTKRGVSPGFEPNLPYWLYYASVVWITISRNLWGLVVMNKQMFHWWQIRVSICWCRFVCVCVCLCFCSTGNSIYRWGAKCGCIKCIVPPKSRRKRGICGRITLGDPWICCWFVRLSSMVWSLWWLTQLLVTRINHVASLICMPQAFVSKP